MIYEVKYEQELFRYSVKAASGKYLTRCGHWTECGEWFIFLKDALVALQPHVILNDEVLVDGNKTDTYRLLHQGIKGCGYYFSGNNKYFSKRGVHTVIGEGFYFASKEEAIKRFNGPDGPIAVFIDEAKEEEKKEMLYYRFLDDDIAAVVAETKVSRTVAEGFVRAAWKDREQQTKAANLEKQKTTLKQAIRTARSGGVSRADAELILRKEYWS